MRMFSKLLAGVAVAATTVALTAAPALADPPSGTVPRATDAVSVGANTTEYLFDQISHQYNAANPKATTKMYGWDATNPVTGAEGDTITTKAKCAGISRPDGTGAGISALEANAQPSGNTKNYCVDFARAAAARTSSEPTCATGGICFVSLAGDAVTWADRSAAAGGTDAPASLSPAQLASIYECKIRNWDKVGGKAGTINAFLPLTSAGTRTFFLTALGGGTTPITPGSCVVDGTTSDPNSLEENEGVNPILNTAGTIFIYSVGDYISQVYHSAACINSGCTPNASGVVCTPTGSENAFGCNESGVLQLAEIGGSKPTTPWPLTSTSKNVAINKSFNILFQRTLSDVVRYDPNTTDHIPGAESGSPGGINLEQFLGASGYLCTNSSAQAQIKNYGFEATWKLSTCGAVS
jgi:ABC-type phosphate transport system substrate-binding protein